MPRKPARSSSAKTKKAAKAPAPAPKSRAKSRTPRAGSPAPRKSAGTPAGRPKLGALAHNDTRVNIPTEDLRDFYHSANPETPAPTLYPRNPDLDPQLVWRGKDEQDREGLAVPVAPIYIQEKIHPQAIIEDFTRTAKRPTKAGGGDDGPSLFADHYAAFNGLPADFAERVDFYRHQGHWQNRLILGDSLLVMNSLAEKEGLKGRVQMVYFDPPYGIKFGSNWQVSTRKRDVKDGKAEDVVRQPEQMRAFRDTWELGIHSYLSYLRDRLTIARELLTESGSIFVQIGDENVHLVRSVLDEVYGSENFVSLITFITTTGAGGGPTGTTSVLPTVCNYLVWYAKDIKSIKYRLVYRDKVVGGNGAEGYNMVELPDGTRRRATVDEIEAAGEQGRIFTADNLTSQTAPPTTIFSVQHDGKKFDPAKGGWKTNRAGMDRLQAARRVTAAGNTLRYVRYFSDFPVFPFTNIWDDTTTAGFADQKVYVVQTNAKVIERCVLMATDPGDLVLDPTCGSGTTAYVAEQWGRRWITTDTSRVAVTLAKTRLMGARFPSYYLADQYPGVGMSTDDDAIRKHLRTAAPAVSAEKADVRRGFVYRRVPHVTLKSIANNPDIKEGLTREEIDWAIKRHAETEVLYDKPFPDDKAVRVCGPFTVESLSPHRQLSVDTKVDRATVGEPDAAEAGKRRVVRVLGPDDFGRMVLENMKRAGVQNTYKNEKMVFQTLDPHPGQWIQGAGRYTDSAGKDVRVGVCIGPEHGTVGAELVKEAAKEAVKGVAFDTLLVAGFAFDPSVGEEMKRYGGLTVLPVRINADIAMGDLLKKTGAGNLFMIFGEPDVAITTGKDGTVTVEIKGLDVYDPTTGEVRSSSTDDIACWFIDTAYNGEAFFVRHAYFTGADEPYDKLKRALKAEVDEAAWSALYSTVSRPFPKPATGKIAVKVINHFGDEVLKVYGVDGSRRR
jgi:adenine-specific DNA-methyltransferase